MKAIYTKNVAADIVEMFEEVLDEYNIKVPSPEDDERGDGNCAKLYGSVYFDLLGKVEMTIYNVLIKHGEGAEVILGQWEATVRNIIHGS